MDAIDEELRALLLRERIAKLIELGLAEHPEPERLAHLIAAGAEWFCEPIARDKFAIRLEITPRSPERAEAFLGRTLPPESWPPIGTGENLIVFDREEASRT